MKLLIPQMLEAREEQFTQLGHSTVDGALT